MSTNTTTAPQQDTRSTRSSIILFYRYHPFTDDIQIGESYRCALFKLCRSLQLTGRILIGSSHRGEGINGTLAGNRDHLRSFTSALDVGKGEEVVDAQGEKDIRTTSETTTEEEDRDAAVQQFWREEKQVFESIGVPPLRMKEEDFKWSSSSSSSSTTDDDDNAMLLFPDLNVKLVKELIGTGGIMSSIPIEETSRGYLTPQQWHDELFKLQQRRRKTKQSSDNDNDINDETDDTVVIDCRNTKEYEIGHFCGAIDPVTTTYSQFPKWVDDNQHLLSGKRVLMYCTGTYEDM